MLSKNLAAEMGMVPTVTLISKTAYADKLLAEKNSRENKTVTASRFALAEQEPDRLMPVTLSFKTYNRMSGPGRQAAVRRAGH